MNFSEQNLGEGINDIYDSHFHRDKDERKYLFSYDIFFIEFDNGFFLPFFYLFIKKIFKLKKNYTPPNIF